MIRLQVHSLLAGLRDQVRILYVGGLGLCLVNIFLSDTWSCVEGSCVKRAYLLGLGDSAYTSKSYQDLERSSKKCPVSGLQKSLICVEWE